MINPHRQQYGLGSFVEEKIVGKPGGLVEPGVRQYGFFKKIFKKVKKGAKKIWKSPLGKIGIGALALGVPWGAGGTGGFGGMFGSKSAWGRGLGMLRNRGILSGAGNIASRAKSGLSKFGYGKAALLGLGAAGVAAPFLGGDEDEEVIDDWSVTPPYIDRIRQMAKDRHPSLAFLPPAESVMSGYYGSKEGGIVGLANGGAAGNAQAEQMLRMEYQKYRNQGGTMSYQQFKMAVLQQAQGQGPRAQGQVADRPMFQGGELVEDESMVEATPEGMMEENVEEVQGEPTREQLEALAMEIFQLRLEELDQEQLMVVYQAAMEQQPREEMMQEDIEFNPQMSAPQMAANGGRIGYANGGMDEMDDLYTKYIARREGEGSQYSPSRSQYESYVNSPIMRYGGGIHDRSNEEIRQQRIAQGPLKFTVPGGEVRSAGMQEGGLMSLGGMEKDYRQEGGFVPLGGEEKADDVPARLSKNEFVFTADAVRAAGGGDIDQGAEVMENVMDNLEQGGQISEESQGLEGARDMFATSERLSEVV